MSGGAEMSPPLISVRKNKEYKWTHLGWKAFIARIIKWFHLGGNLRVTHLPPTQSLSEHVVLVYFLFLQRCVSSVIADENSTHQNIQTSIFTEFSKMDFR